RIPSIRDTAGEFLNKEFDVREKVKNVQVVGREGKEVIIVELINWEVKEKIMKEKKKLVGRRVYIDHDMLQEERDVRRKLRERARSEREKGKSVKVVLDNVTEGMDGEFMLIGGDFNIRIGEMGGGEEEDGGMERKSKDKLVSNGGKGLIEFIQGKGWYVLNGTTADDWEGEYTFVGARGSSRKGKERKDKFLEEKRKLKELAEQKQREKREEEEIELKNLRSVAEVWKFINRKKRKKVWREANIRKEAWKKHFMELLEETEGQMDYGNSSNLVRTPGVQEYMEEELPSEEEVHEAVKKLRTKKAVGVDGIPMEAWKYGGRFVRNGLVELIRQIWMEGDFPKDWKTSIIVPLHKRGDQEVVGNYRGISLLCSAYKIYAEILRNRLELEVERLGLLPESQAGFRRGRSTMDNVFILNHLVQREKKKEGKESKVYALFVDLKAAFDNVDRKQLWSTLKDNGVNLNILKRLEKVYE
ncbi:uncharacterized protein LOC112462473, partial [Temnothorax curvispinosus]|uniref:Uncharacterized protein LOC112462473 n=1 Tax=Temnothorax curvispinosus TaxID=300111 RepID=A0A6J1QNM1_9HYME